MSDPLPPATVTTFSTTSGPSRNTEPTPSGAAEPSMWAVSSGTTLALSATEPETLNAITVVDLQLAVGLRVLRVDLQNLRAHEGRSVALPLPREGLAQRVQLVPQRVSGRGQDK